MHRNITKSKFFYTILGIHALCGILGLTILCSVPEMDQIRWNIGYIIGYLFVLSLIFSFFIRIPDKVPKGVKYGIRIYRNIYLLSIIMSLLIPKGLFMLLVIFIDCSSNSEKIAEDKQYIIRHYEYWYEDPDIPLSIRVNYDMGVARISFAENLSLPYIYKLKKK